MPPPYFDWPPAPTWPDKYWWKCQTNLKKPVWQIPRNVQGQIQGEQKFSWSRWWRSGFETDQKGWFWWWWDLCRILAATSTFAATGCKENSRRTDSKLARTNSTATFHRRPTDRAKEMKEANQVVLQVLRPNNFCVRKFIVSRQTHDLSIMQCTTTARWLKLSGFLYDSENSYEFCAYYCVAMKPLPEKP